MSFLSMYASDEYMTKNVNLFSGLLALSLKSIHFSRSSIQEIRNFRMFLVSAQIEEKKKQEKRIFKRQKS